MYSKFKIQKSKVVLTGFLFIVLQIAVLLPSFGLINNPIQDDFSNEVCAQTVQSGGGTCEREFAECPDDHSNFFQSLGDGSVSAPSSLGSESLQEQLINQHGDEGASQLCVKDRTNGVIERDGAIYECLDSYFPAEDQSTAASKKWGCCPVNADYVYLQGACCRVVNDLPTPNEYQENNGGCRYRKPGDSFATPIDYSSVNDGIPTVVTNSQVYGSPIGLVNPGNVTNSPFSCSAGSVCALTDNGEVIPATQLEEQSGLSCNECYALNEPIVLDAANGQMEICTGSDLTDYPDATQLSEVSASVPLINGNVNDTLAYYAAAGDAGNQEALKTCRERGGIYIALGCIDPTPVGVITGMIRIGFGVVGGVALIQLILAGIAYQSGEEAKIEEARGKVFTTIGGVLVLVFSVLILRIIGVNILDVIPGGAI